MTADPLSALPDFGPEIADALAEARFYDDPPGWDEYDHDPEEEGW